MKTEIERKFLVKNDDWRADADAGKPCRQGYFCSGSDDATVRVRLINGEGFLTIKGPAVGISRPEFEYEIPSNDASYMLDHLCGERVIEKTRYILERNGFRWEIDEFCGAHKGLVLAEIELNHEKQGVDLPNWLGKEVSRDFRYTNVFLASGQHRKSS